uniref:1 putative n=1 Tax=Albugo laibachii Nc14 TaxID=890382 RepID=F0W3S8_9STRA|nr:1 putative [Albugo laibachii Nc14]|eukprot:CCA15748.1 1 putative [Albugo laibachii Nc14]
MQKTIYQSRKRGDSPKGESNNVIALDRSHNSFPALSLHATNRKLGKVRPRISVSSSKYGKAEKYLSEALRTHEGNFKAANDAYAREKAALDVILESMQNSGEGGALKMASSLHYKNRFLNVLLKKLVNGIMSVFFRHWNQVSREIRRQSKERAVMRIMHIFRDRMRTIQQKNFGTQKIATMHQIAEQLRDQLNQASRLQMWWRRTQLSTRVKRAARYCRSACTIQRWYRSYTLHRAMKLSHANHVRRNQMAILLQASFRGMHTRNFLRINKRKDRDAKETMLLVLRHTSRTQMLHWEWTRNGAVYLIQTRLIIPFLTRRRVEQQKEENKVTKAISVLSRPLKRWSRLALAHIREAHSLRLFSSLEKSDPCDFMQLTRFDFNYPFLDLERIARNEQWKALRVRSTLLRRIYWEWMNGKAQETIFRLRKKDKIEGEEWEALTLLIRLAAVRIQSHLRGWVQRCKYETSRTRKRKLAKINRQQRIRRIESLVNDSASSSHIANWDFRILRSDISAAKIIQSFFRKCQARFQALLCVWKQKATFTALKMSRRRRAAISIQIIFRYSQARKVVKQLRAEHALRRRMRQRYHHKRNYQEIAVRRITRWITWIIKMKRIRKNSYLRRVENQPISRLQRWARRRVSRILPLSSLARRNPEASESHLHNTIDISIFLSPLRIQAERTVYCQQSLMICQQKFMNQLIMDPILRSLNNPRHELATSYQIMEELEMFVGKNRSNLVQAVNSPVSTFNTENSQTPSFPIIAMIFYYVAGNKEPASWPDADSNNNAVPNTYQTERTDGTRIMTFFKKLQRSPLNINKSKKSDAIKGNRAFFSIPELDHAVTTAAGSTPNIDVHLFYHIIFILVECSTSIEAQSTNSDAHLDVKLRCVRPYAGTEASIVAFLKQHLFHLPELSIFWLALTRYVTHWLESKAVPTIVCAFRRLRTKNRIENLRKLRQSIAHKRIFATKAIILQKTARMYLARRMFKCIIQKCYRKYYDVDLDVSFWRNPTTGYETWRKPGALGDDDVEREIIPAACRDEKPQMACQGQIKVQETSSETGAIYPCKEVSTWFCYTCKMFLCSNCCQIMHETRKERKGLNESLQDFTTDVAALHDVNHIVLCGICSLFAATRQCVECFEKELKESKLNLSNKRDGRRGSAHLSLYCDDCFGFIHRRGALQAHQFCYLSPFCDDCQSQNEVQEKESTKSDEASFRIHTNMSLTKPADTLRYLYEGSTDNLTKAPASAQYICRACDDRKICTNCAKLKHPKELCGPLDRLHPCTRRELNETLQQRTRIDEAKRLNAIMERRQNNSEKLLEKQRVDDAARKIYSFLKNFKAIALARQIRRKKQLAKDSIWRQRQIDAKIERHMLYQLQLFFGVARPLPSDTKILQALRHLNAYQRRRLMIRARQFGLLVEEYILHGIPLPGVVSCKVTQASSSVWLETSEDLRGWVLPRQTLRLRPIHAARHNHSNSLTQFSYEPAVLTRTWLEAQEAQDLLVCIDSKRKIHEKRIPIVDSIVPFDYDKKRWINFDEMNDPAIQQEILCHAFLVEFSLDNESHVWLAPVFAQRFWEWRHDCHVLRTMITGQVENASTKVGCHANGTKPIGSFGHSSSSSNCYKNQDNTEMRLASIKQKNNLVESKGFTNGSPNQSQEHVSMTTVNCMYRYTCSLLKCQREVVEKRMHQLQVKRVKLQTKRERVKRKLIETEKRFSEYEEKTALIRPAQTNRGGMSQESSRGFIHLTLCHQSIYNMGRVKKMGLGEFLGEKKNEFIPEASLPSGPRLRDDEDGNPGGRRRGYGRFQNGPSNTESSDQWRNERGGDRLRSSDRPPRREEPSNWRFGGAASNETSSRFNRFNQESRPMEERPAHLKLNLHSNREEGSNRFDRNDRASENVDKFSRAFKSTGGDRFGSRFDRRDGRDSNRTDRDNSSFGSFRNREGSDRNSSYRPEDSKHVDRNPSEIASSFRSLNVKEQNASDAQQKSDKSDKKAHITKLKEKRKLIAEKERLALEEAKLKAAAELKKEEEDKLARVTKDGETMAAILVTNKLGKDLVEVAKPIYEEKGRVYGAHLVEAILEKAKETAKSSANWIAPEQYGELLRFGLSETSSVREQVQVLYALQLFLLTLDFPKGVLEKCFMALYSLDIIEEAAFLEYKYDVDGTVPGRMRAIVQTSNWLTWLETPESEEEDEVEDDAALVDPLYFSGNKIFHFSTGNEMRMKGMAYQPTPNAGKLSTVTGHDFVTDDNEAVWSEHLEAMIDLGINTIRLYSVDPSKSHDKFMCACAKAGIYVLIGMSAPCVGCAVPTKPAPICYPPNLFKRAQMIYNAFAVYNNVLGFSVGNENNLEIGSIETAPCVKAFLRDVRNYAAHCSGSLRIVPVGLDQADILPRAQWLSYYDCIVDDNAFTRADWQGLNPYAHCDMKVTEFEDAKGLLVLVEDFNKIGLAKPLMLGEYGCIPEENTVEGWEAVRTFRDAKWMNTEKPLTDNIVGGCVFEFSTELKNRKDKTLAMTRDAGDYGVFQFQPRNCDNVVKKCELKPKEPEVRNLKFAYTTTPDSTINVKTWKPMRSEPLKCPKNISIDLPPTPKVDIMKCSTRQPVCNGEKHNAFKKKDENVKMGDKVSPSNAVDTNVEISSLSGGSKVELSTTSAILSVAILIRC